jgi:hypothetical protein
VPERLEERRVVGQEQEDQVPKDGLRLSFGFACRNRVSRAFRTLFGSHGLKRSFPTDLSTFGSLFFEVFSNLAWQSLRHDLILTGFRSHVKKFIDIYRGFRYNRQVKAIGYVRVSTEKQVDFGVSLDAQSEKVRAMAVMQGAELLELIIDAG